MKSGRTGGMERTGKETDMRLEAVGKSDIGKRRENNQDAFGIYQKDDAGMYVVADGMGGHADGEKASRIVVTELSNWWNAFSPVLFGADFRKMVSSIEQTVAYANERIYAEYNKGEICGTTAVVLFIYKDSYGIIYAGDSRCYLWGRQGNSLLGGKKWKQMTVDEVWENQPERSPEERRSQSHPNRGKLVNAIGIKKSIRCRIITDRIPAGAVFLLCSDGLYKFCAERFLKKAMKTCAEQNAMAEILDGLIGRVYENGAKDNVTAVLVRCSEK